MTLLLILVMIVVALFALFWGGGMLAQGYLYNQPADRFPLRAAAAALLVGIFLTLWCWLDMRSPGRYDTFFEFAPYETRTYDEFDAVRWQADPAAQIQRGKLEFKKGDNGEPVEKVSKFKRAPGGKTGAFVEEGTGEPFQLSGTPKTGGLAILTVRMDVPVDGQPVKFKMDVARDRRSGKPSDPPVYTDDKRFTEEGGSRYIRGDQPGTMFVPSSSMVALALLVNLLHFVAWFVAFWVIMQFRWGHALGFAAALGLVTMLLIMPLLFKQVRKPAATAPPAEKAALAVRGEPGA